MDNTVENNIAESITAGQAPAGWGIELQSAGCTNCQAVFYIRAEDISPICPRCLQRTISPQTDTSTDTLQYLPELIIPFSAQKTTITRAVENFAAKIPYAPQDLNAENIFKRLTPHYLSAWLVDVDVKANWQAEMGYNYQVVSHQDRYDQATNRWLSQEIQETRIRWEPRLGSLSRIYPNIGAPALDDEPRIRQTVGDFDPRLAQTYNSSALPQRVYIEMPDRDTDDAWPEAIVNLHKQAAEECRLAGSADHIRSFKWDPQFTQNSWTLMLRPTYSTFYLDDSQKPHKITIHGATGAIQGSRIASMARAQSRALTLVITAAVIVFIGLLVGVAGLLFPPVIFFAGLLLFIGIVVGFSAIIPLVQVWQFNRQQRT